MSDKFTIDGFVDWLGTVEGVKDHQSQEQSAGQTTYGYGVLPSTAKKYGVVYTETSDRRENAIKVYNKMCRDCEDEIHFALTSVSVDLGIAILSLYINLGSFKNANTLVRHLYSGEFDEAARSLFNYVNLKVGDKYFVSKGLVARRAKEYNLFAKALGLKKAIALGVYGPRVLPIFKITMSGGEFLTFTSKYPLHPENSFTSVNI